MKITISQNDLDSAVKKEIITEQQADSLWELFSGHNKSKITFTGLNVVYYFGALIIISAMTWFATEAFAKYNALGLLSVGIFYFVGLLIFGKKLYTSEQAAVSK